MLYTLAELNDAELSKVAAFETETGKKALVLRELDVEADELTPEELSHLRELERELGYVVVVVK